MMDEFCVRKACFLRAKESKDLVELERENPVEPPVPQQEKVSTTDPDATYATKGSPAQLGYSLFALG